MVVVRWSVLALCGSDEKVPGMIVKGADVVVIRPEVVLRLADVALGGSEVVLCGSDI